VSRKAIKLVFDKGRGHWAARANRALCWLHEYNLDSAGEAGPTATTAWRATELLRHPTGSLRNPGLRASPMPMVKDGCGGRHNSAEGRGA